MQQTIALLAEYKDPGLECKVDALLFKTTDNATKLREIKALVLNEIKACGPLDEGDDGHEGEMLE